MDTGGEERKNSGVRPTHKSNLNFSQGALWTGAGRRTLHVLMDERIATFHVTAGSGLAMEGGR